MRGGGGESDPSPPLPRDLRVDLGAVRGSVSVLADERGEPVSKQRLGKDEVLIVAWAQPASGPGWANRPLWYIVRTADGKLVERCLQPEEQTRDIVTLYPFSAMATGHMGVLVEGLLKGGK